MAFVRRTRPARSNTEPGIRIDWDHPLAQGLLFYGPFFYRNAPVDLAAGIPLIRDNGGTPSNSGIAKTKWGLALESNSLNGFGVWHHRYASSLIRRLVGGSKWSMAIACELDSRNTAGTASILMTVPYAGSGSWASPYHLIDIECEKADDTSPMGMTSGAAIGGTLRNGTTATDCVYIDGAAHVYAVSYNTSITSGAISHYTDGKFIEASSTPASGTIDDPGASGGYRVWMFGKGTADGTALGEGIDGRIHASAIWNRLLTANEHALFAADPLCMAVVDEWIWIPDATSYFGVSEIKGTLVNQTGSFPIYVMTDPTQTHIASSGDKLTELAIYASHNSGPTTLDVGVWDITAATSRTDIAGCPLVAVSAITVTGAVGWKTGAVDVALVAGHEYAVGFAATSGSVATYRNTTDNKIYARSSSTGLDDLATEADPFPTASSGLSKDRTYSVRGKVERSASAINTAPPKIVQRAHLNDDASSTTLVATFPDPTTPGNTIAGIVAYNNGEANTLITSMTESYVLDGGFTEHSYRVDSFYCEDIIGGSETFTVTLNATKSYRVIQIVEIEGGTFDDGAFIHDDTASGTDDASSGNVTTTADNDLLVGFYVQITNQNLPAPGTGFSIIDTIVNPGGNAQMTEARIVPFASTAAATFTPAGSSYYTWIAGLAFKPRRAPKIAHVPTTLGSSAGQIFTTGDSSGEGDVPYPAVVAYGDIAYLWLFVGDVASSGNVLLTADGTWTDITGVIYDSGAGDEAGARLYWRRCNGTEGGTTTPVTFDDTASGVPLRMGQIVTVSDAPATGTPHEAVQTAHGNGASVEASATTTLGPDRLGLRFYATAEDDQGADSTPPYRWTRGQQLITGSASDGAFGVDYRTMSAEGTYPATSMLGSGFDGWATVSLAIKPKTEDAGDGFEDIVHLGNSLVGTVANGGTLTIPSRRYTAGSTIFVTVATYKSGGPSVTSISGAGATWARVGSAPTAQNNGTTETWIGTGNTGGETTLTVTLPSNSYAAGASSEFTGLDESAYDQTGSTSSNTSTTSTSVTAGGANSQDNMLALATFSFSVSDATANIQDPPTTGYSSIGVHQDANAVIGYGSAYKIISAGETSSAAWTHDTGGGRVAQIFTFKAASIGGGGGVSIPIPVGTLTITGLQPVAKSARLEILSISVTRLYEGLTGVVITGYGFGASQGTSKVMLDGVTQTVTSWSDTSITFNVVAPSGYASPRTLQVQRPY